MDMPNVCSAQHAWCEVGLWFCARCFTFDGLEQDATVRVGVLEKVWIRTRLSNGVSLCKHFPLEHNLQKNTVIQWRNLVMDKLRHVSKLSLFKMLSPRPFEVIKCGLLPPTGLVWCWVSHYCCVVYGTVKSVNLTWCVLDIVQPPSDTY